MKETLDINDIRSKLKSPLPGKAAQYKMAPDMREYPEDTKNYKNAAVMVLLYPKNNRLHTIFIKRNEYKGVHSRQISLPGGMVEKEDKNLAATALRECREETGVSEKDIVIIGKLTTLPIPVSKFLVHPYVGYIHYEPSFFPDSNEVQYLILPKLEEFLTNTNIKTGLLKRPEYEINAPYYHIKNEKIWGATAMIMSEFMELIDY